MMKNNKYFVSSFYAFTLLLAPLLATSELVAVDDEILDGVSGQSGITLNAKVILGDESSFVFTNTSGKKLDDPTLTAAETSYLIVDEIKISGKKKMSAQSLLNGFEFDKDAIML